MPYTLLTGANGFIGSHVAARLVERGDEVRATVRSGSGRQTLEQMGIKTVKADIRDRPAMRRALRGADRVFHVAGTTNLALPRAEAFSQNVEGTRIVLEEALRAEVTRLVYTSSVAAIGPAPAGQVADESNVWDAGGYRIPYVDSKHEAEATAMRLLARGLPLVIVNPAHVMGAGDPGRSSTTLVKRFLRRQIPAYVDGTLNIVGVEDVADGHLRADEQGAIGERYILGNRNFTFDRLFADLARLSGVEPPPLKLPVSVALALAGAAQRIPTIKAPEPVEIRAASLNWAFTSKKAKRELEWRPAPHEDSLQATIDFYREREPRLLPARPLRQPLPLRIAAGAIKRIGVGIG